MRIEIEIKITNEGKTQIYKQIDRSVDIYTDRFRDRQIDWQTQICTYGQICNWAEEVRLSRDEEC